MKRRQNHDVWSDADVLSDLNSTGRVKKDVLTDPGIVSDGHLALRVPFEHGSMADVDVLSKRDCLGIPGHDSSLKDNVRSDGSKVVPLKGAIPMRFKFAHRRNRDMSWTLQQVGGTISAVFDSLSLVVAAYDEQEALATTLERVETFLVEHVREWELIIVDDGSSDGTGLLMDQWARSRPNVYALHHERNRGMGAALTTGYGAASKSWVTMLPGDGQIDPYELPKLFALSSEADLVTSLYENRLETPFRRLLSLGLRFLTVLIVGSRAGTEGTYLVRREVLEKLNATSESFLLNLEIPIRAKKGRYRVRTGLIRVTPRKAGVSKAATLGRTFQTFRELFKLRIKLMKKQ